MCESCQTELIWLYETCDYVTLCRIWLCETCDYVTLCRIWLCETCDYVTLCRVWLCETCDYVTLCRIWLCETCDYVTLCRVCAVHSSWGSRLVPTTHWTMSSPTDSTTDSMENCVNTDQQQGQVLTRFNYHNLLWPIHGSSCQAVMSNQVYLLCFTRIGSLILIVECKVSWCDSGPWQTAHRWLVLNPAMALLAPGLIEK